MSPASKGSPRNGRVYDLRQYSLPHHPRPSRSTAASPMAIPRACQESAPPALPPPRYLKNVPNGGGRQSTTHGSIHPGLVGAELSAAKVGSGLPAFSVHRQASGKAFVDHIITKGFDPGSSTSLDDSISEHRREHATDPDTHSIANPRPVFPNDRFVSEPHVQRDAYDRQLLSKIGGLNHHHTRVSLAACSRSVPDTAIPTLHKPNEQARPLPVPERAYASLDSPLSRQSGSDALSPIQHVFRNLHFDPSLGPRYGPPPSSAVISTPGSLNDMLIHQGSSSCDHASPSDLDFGAEENGMHELNIRDHADVEPENYPPGSKRRASSPPPEAAQEDRHVSCGRTDLLHRRSAQTTVNQNSSSSRPLASSVSSVGSLGPRFGSIGSSYGRSTAASSMTSSYGDQHSSPNTVLLHKGTDLGSSSPNVYPSSLDQNSRSSAAKQQHHSTYYRALSQMDRLQNHYLSPESSPFSSQHSATDRISTTFMCECCPKKPKRFDTADELRAHELEKQYICQYCKNRFKNKNEAERHQNSLHLRLQSWSCAVLATPNAAFHRSTTHPCTNDVCGYCGEEFLNPADWEQRSEHLNRVHKFGECNQAKKFWRADHFRQHLKHSHAGISGKWTNMLENACMQEKPHLERVGFDVSISDASSGSGNR